MGKWTDNEEKMQKEVREELIKALWEKIIHEEKQEKFFILKAVLGLFDKNEKNEYIKSSRSEKFEEAILNKDFTQFKALLESALYELSKSKGSLKEIIAESDKKLAEIQMGEHLSLPLVDNTDPIITQEDIDDLKEYLQENNIAASVSIFNNGQSYNVEQKEFGENPIFSIHSVGKIFTGILLLKLLNEGKLSLSEEDLDKPVDLNKAVLEKLPPLVQERLKNVTVKQLMIHESGLGDYSDNKGGVCSAIEQKLNNNDTLEITASKDLLPYADEKMGPLGQFQYSNLGILLLGFAIENKHKDGLTIDELMHQFVKEDLKLTTFENKRPKEGHFNTTDQKNAEGVFLKDKGEQFIKDYVSARYACTAGGYWTTNADLQKFGEWIKKHYEQDKNFERLIKTHGSEFYNKDKQAIEHSGLHADTAHLYVSLRNGTVISVLSPQGERAATNLVDSILKQTTWFKNELHPEEKITNKNKI